MEFAELIKTPRADNVVLHRPFHAAVEGTLCLTGHHLIFSSRRHDNARNSFFLFCCRFVGSLGTIVIKCKRSEDYPAGHPGMEESNIASSIEVRSYHQP
uniref:GRAM domain-containing protein n=1 Tax=Malurus cyaneus samueli TaxID=2593467 RepID=A0A8C5TRB7_9PASS